MKGNQENIQELKRNLTSGEEKYQKTLTLWLENQENIEKLKAEIEDLRKNNSNNEDKYQEIMKEKFIFLI